MKTKLIDWRDLDKKWMKNPKFVKAWEKVEPEYQLARSLIGARLKRKMTQSQLARKIGTKQPVISRIEGMSSTPTVSLLKRVAAALDTRLKISFIPK
ncbi:helix-turn-helix transcriptional regulator [Candidatus Gottesmanbacteria bacterium]|nr:helix-turn-helix transcriptional regulator [Candidatus Gottesmanbacteria bacterium]